MEFKHLDFLEKADALIIVPPFVGTERPSLAAHILQSCSAEKGEKVNVLYGNLLFASIIGEEQYEAFWSFMKFGICERLFAKAAFGIASLSEECLSENDITELSNFGLELNKLVEIQNLIELWLDNLVDVIVSKGYKVIGCSTTFEQTAASIAIINRVKKKNPSIVTVMGGANCTGELAEGILSLSDKIDYVFSDDSETTFPTFIKAVLEENLPDEKIIVGEPCINLEEIPNVDYGEYYEQVNEFLSGSLGENPYNLLLVYETSRGCWWGEKCQCAFCGMNGSTVKYRHKSPGKAIKELKELLKKHPSRKIAMVDCVIPKEYLTDFLPNLQKEIPDISICYEVKSSFKFTNLVSLKNAGVNVLQPGIEALSTSLLKRMNKGVSAKNNLLFLKYSIMLEFDVSWNIMYGFPEDRKEEYIETLRVIKMIKHFQPPNNLSPMSLERFSEYYNNADKYNIKNIKPLDYYQYIFPETAKLEKLAIHFAGEFNSFARNDKELMKEIYLEVEEWKSRWYSEKRPKLEIIKASDDQYMVLDTREIPNTEGIHFFNKEQAHKIVFSRYKQLYSVGEDGFIQWAIDKKLLIEVDDVVISLVTCSNELFEEFKNMAQIDRDKSIIELY